MAGDNKRHCILRRSVAVILLLFLLSPSLTCFSLQGLSKKVKQEKSVNEAAVTEGRTGRILFNGTELNFNSRTSSAAKANNRLSHVDSAQSDGAGKVLMCCIHDVQINESKKRVDVFSINFTFFNSKEMLGQILQLETAHEAAWKRLKPILSCDQNKMKLKAMGPGAAYLQLDMGIATVKSHI